MRQTIGFAVAAALALSACSENKDVDPNEALASINVIDESNLSDLYLTAADPKEAEALTGTRLYLPRGRLPAAEAGEWYHADLIGLRAVGGVGPLRHAGGIQGL